MSKDAQELASSTSLEQIRKTTCNSEEHREVRVGTEGTEGILKTDVTKKIPYHIGEKYGVLLQFYIDAEIKDSKLPIKTTKIEITI